MSNKLPQNDQEGIPGYLGGLDGLRCLAVVAVLAFHADARLAPNGYVGVDIFFVLSGFLITRILLSEYYSTGRIALSSFYMRRFLRLYPALFAVCTFVAILGLVTGRNTASLLGESIFALVYVSNIRYDLGGSSTTVLSHTWTLSLEEQFYLLWPPLLILLLALGRKGRWPQLLASSALFALTLAILLGLSLGIGLHTYLRATGLLFGCMLSILMSRRTVSIPRWLGLTSCVLLIAVTFWPATIPGGIFQNGFSPIALLTVPALVAATDTSSPAARFLSLKAMVWVGRRSYGIYLWHFPVLTLAIHQSPKSVPPSLLILAGIITTITLAAISYRFVELPFLRLKNRYSRGLGPSNSHSLEPLSSGSGAAPKNPDQSVRRP